ncbi:hypothetical protein [Limoniibacter endophyticus]|uniref:Uncharacterized protein n=1 Tax=Limoniibacter endophyticus TaxID=1565040 RepID=A0A8J3DL22_9HYPH|nr:hypothetical protein [Limoniibacter endophyticus]GHC79473.1 hypothetical protein GCM10010136_32040 [Limoniibacter endophyticus]
MIDPYVALDRETALAYLDLAAQQTMAKWAMWTVIVSGASALVSAGALLGLFLSLRQTRRAMLEARFANEIQSQAYAFVEAIEHGTTTPFTARVTNTGATPATHFLIGAKAEIIKRGSKPASVKVDEIKLNIWTRLGAQEKTTVGLDVEDRTDIEAFNRNHVGDDEILLVSGRLIYTTVHNHDHQSHFMFYADRQNSSVFRRPNSNLPTFERMKLSKADKQKFRTIWDDAV